MSLQRKLARQKIGPAIINRPPQQHGFWLTEKEYNDLRADISAKAAQQSIIKVLALVAYILWFHWGELQQRKHRLRVLYDLYKKYLDLVPTPTADMKEAEHQFFMQTGCEIQR